MNSVWTRWRSHTHTAWGVTGVQAESSRFVESGSYLLDLIGSYWHLSPGLSQVVIIWRTGCMWRATLWAELGHYLLQPVIVPLTSTDIEQSLYSIVWDCVNNCNCTNSHSAWTWTWMPIHDMLRDITLRSLRLCCCSSCRCIWGTTCQLCARHQRSTVQHW